MQLLEKEKAPTRRQVERRQLVGGRQAKYVLVASLSAIVTNPTRTSRFSRNHDIESSTNQKGRKHINVDGLDFIANLNKRIMNYCKVGCALHVVQQSRPRSRACDIMGELFGPGSWRCYRSSSCSETLSNNVSAGRWPQEYFAGTRCPRHAGCVDPWRELHRFHSTLSSIALHRYQAGFWWQEESECIVQATYCGQAAGAFTLIFSFGL